MIYDVYRVGKAICGMEDTGMDPLLNPETPKNITNVISLGFLENGDKLKYTGVDVTDYNADNAQKYLLRKASSNGANYGPSAQLTETEKTLTKKIVPWFKEASLEFSRTEKGSDVFSKIYNFLMENKERVVTEINEQLPKGKNRQI